MKDQILDWYVEMFELFERDRDLIPEGALHELKYEELEEEPLRELEKIYSTLNLPDFQDFCEQADAYLQRVKSYKKNVFSLDDESKTLVNSRWRKTFENYGYEIVG